MLLFVHIVTIYIYIYISVNTQVPFLCCALLLIYRVSVKANELVIRFLQGCLIRIMQWPYCRKLTLADMGKLPVPNQKETQQNLTQIYIFGEASQIARFLGPAWGPLGSCQPQTGPMLAPWTLLSWTFYGMKMHYAKKNLRDKLWGNYINLQNVEIRHRSSSIVFRID